MKMRKVIFLIFVVGFVKSIGGNFPLPAITPEYCNSTEYFDSICVRCKRCGKDEAQAKVQHRDHDGSCTCKSGYYEKFRESPHNITCEMCPADQFPSSNGKYCLSCGKTNPYNVTLNSCEPCNGGVLVEDGKELVCFPCQTEKEHIELSARCNSCSAPLIPSPSSCAHLNKIYSGGTCLSPTSIEPSHLTIKFENGISVLSDFFATKYAAALESCKEDDSACQVLANMCVMSMYKISIENICAEFRKLSKKRLDQCPRRPLWLFYIDEDSQRDAKRDLYRDNVPNIFAPYPALKSQLYIYAMKYALNGTFLGLFKVTSDTLNLCPESDVEDDLGFSFGTRLEKFCKVSLQKLWDNSELVFYDLYLASNNSRGEFYPIPVHIDGIIVNGEFVNKGSDMSKWLLVQRFFLTDHESGIENGTKVNRKQHQPFAKVFRYASEVSLKITTKDDGNPGTIYPPLLSIIYSEAIPEDYMQNKKVTIKFSVSYQKDQSFVMQGVMIANVVLGVIAFVWSAIQTFSWFRRSDKHAIDLLTLGKFLIFICGNLANVFFIVLLCVSLKWFIFFKRQDVIYTLLPTADQEQFLSIYLGVAFTMKAFQLIHLLAVQCNINIFFIDWERPRVRASTSGARVSSSSKNVAESSTDSKKGSSTTLKSTPDKINTEMAGVSIWRTYFAANEWAEIQSKRKLNLLLQVFGVLFFLKVLDFEDYALAGPNFKLPSSEVKKYVPYSTCCRFALGASVYLSVALLQIIFRKAIYERFIEDKLQQYVDLCSVSNVSVFILVTKRYGYYIHGRSTHGKADVNMKEMHEFLRKEEEDLCGHRGLIPNTEQQTFQIVLPSGVHDQFLRLLVPLTSYSQAADRMQGVGGRLAKVDIDRVANTHYMLNKFLSGFIEHSFKDLDYVVKDKVLLENLLDIECYEVADRGYFYNDDGHSFASVLFFGNESVLLLFDVLLFSIIDIAASDYVLAVVLTALIAKIIMTVRRSAGRRNLVRRALVDERFLT